LQCVAVCCSVLLCIAVYCSVLHCIAAPALMRSRPYISSSQHIQACCWVLQRVAACCSVLQCVAVCCSVLQGVAVCCSIHLLNCKVDMTCHRANTSKRVAVWCSMLQCLAVSCSVLQCLAVYCRIHLLFCKKKMDMTCHRANTSYLCIAVLVGSLKFSFAKEPYKRDNILQKRPIFFFRPTAIKPTHPILVNTAIALSCSKFLF